jgi:hypothetical protein
MCFDAKKESDLIKLRFFCPLLNGGKCSTQHNHNGQRDPNRESENNPISHARESSARPERSQTRFHVVFRKKNPQTNTFSSEEMVFWWGIHCSKSLDDIILVSARELSFLFVLVLSREIDTKRKSSLENAGRVRNETRLTFITSRDSFA